MQELVDELLALRSACNEKVKHLSDKYALPTSSSPVGGLAICSNGTTLTAELTSYYKKRWEELRVGHLDAATKNKIRGENVERLVLVTKFNFIHAMSGFEFAARGANKVYPNVLGLSKRRLYLGEILKESTVRGLIEPISSERWDGAIKIRNCLVHNNGIADETCSWTFSDRLILAMDDGKMMQGTILTFPRLTAWAASSFGDWCDKFLQACQV